MTKLKPQVEPTIDYHLLYDEDDILALILKGHLVIEAMLIKLLEYNLESKKNIYSNYVTKLNLCINSELLPSDTGIVCKDINDIRNKYCHSLGYKLSFEDAFEYVNKWANLGLEYSDTKIFENKNESKKYYGVIGILTETLTNTMFNINETFEELSIKTTY